MLINWNRFVLLLLPIKMRYAGVFDVCREMISHLVDVHNDLLAYQQDVDYRLYHTSQVWSIEKLLNDRFDQDDRRIYIADASSNRAPLLYKDGDARPIMTDTDNDTPVLYINPDSGYTGGEFDFIVHTPYRYSANELVRMRALIDYYRLASKRYTITSNQ